MKRHSLVMKTREYFLLKNYLVELRQQGTFDNDIYMQKFYKSFAIESSIVIPRNLKSFNDKAVVVFDLAEEHSLLSAVGLFCREHYLDLKANDLDLANALETLKNYIVSELMLDLNI